MECYSPFRKNGILTFVTASMTLDNTVLSEISQTTEGKYGIIWLLNEDSKIVKPIEAEIRIVAARIWGGRAQGGLVLVKSFSYARLIRLRDILYYIHYAKMTIVYYLPESLQESRSYVKCSCHKNNSNTWIN
jgi:hypothetical protein